MRKRSPAGRGRRRLLWGGAGALAGLVLMIGWLAWTAQRARVELVAARAALPAVRTAVLTGDGTGATKLAVVQRHARAADDLTHDPVWYLAGAVPWLGSPIDTAQGMTRSVDELATHSLPRLVTAADTMHPAQLLSAGRVDVEALRRAEPALSDVAASLQTQRDALATLQPSWLGPIADAHRELLAELTSVADASSAAAQASRLIPPMLGLQGQRRYFVAFQNPAEARASGGLLDAYAIVIADRGRVRIDRIGANVSLPPFSGPVTAVDQDFADRYAALGATSHWFQANVSPHFPDVATAWAAMWQKATGQQIDGAVALTPRALAAVLTATGPVSAPVVGTVDAARIERLVLHEQYVMPQLGAQRKSIMLGVGSAAIDALLKGDVSPGKLLPELRTAANDGHVLVHSRVAAEQSRLTEAGISGAVVDGDAPFAQAVVVNIGGNKLDSWLSTTLDYTVTSCTPAQRAVQIRVTLRNDAPTTGLPAYVTVRSDLPPEPVKPGQNRSELEVLLTRGARLQSATLDGAPLTLALPEGELPQTLPADDSASFLQDGETRGRPSYWLELETVPGQPRTLVLDVVEPPSTAVPILPRQVMVRPQVVRADLGRCAAGTGS